MARINRPCACPSHVQPMALFLCRWAAAPRSPPQPHSHTSPRKPYAHAAISENCPAANPPCATGPILTAFDWNNIADLATGRGNRITCAPAHTRTSSSPGAGEKVTPRKARQASPLFSPFACNPRASQLACSPLWNAVRCSDAHALLLPRRIHLPNPQLAPAQPSQPLPRPTRTRARPVSRTIFAAQSSAASMFPTTARVQRWPALAIIWAACSRAPPRCRRP